MKRAAISLLTALGATAVLFNNCSQIDSEVGVASSAGAIATRTCVPGPGATGSPQTIDEAVSLINSLPMPVSVACFLESLDRPLDIYGTNSTGSAQPSTDVNNPRIFIIRNNLYISVTPNGIAKTLVEFSHLETTTTSAKGELEFPITSPIATSLPFDRIQFGGGTTCRFCHTGEIQGSTVSQAIRPNPFARVSAAALQQQHRTCDPIANRYRCDIFQSIFGYGPVRSIEFPASMPTL